MEEEEERSEAGDTGEKRRWVPPANQPWARLNLGKASL